MRTLRTIILVAALLLCWMPAAKADGVSTGNLLTNPGAETGDLTGWTADGPGAPMVDDGSFDPGINPHTGRFDFSGNAGIADSLSQTVSILVSGITPGVVDSGTLLANLSFWEQGLEQGDPSDDASVQLTFLDGSAAVIGLVTSPAVDSHNSTWLNYSNTYPIPVGTRSITYKIQFTLNSGSDLDAFVDDNSLTISQTDKPGISAGGVISAYAFGASTSVAPSSWIEIYGANLATNTRSWVGADFSGVNAPTSLDGTRVTIGGLPAFLDFISPSQINVQVPSDLGPGPQLTVVTTNTGVSPAFSIPVKLEAPGLLAPASFNVGGNQNVVALFPDGATYVLPPGSIAGVTSRRARAGDVITLYGIGFGAVTPAIPAGQIVGQLNTVAAPFHLLFGQAEATLKYDGLAPNAIGLYQFNVEVPNVTPSDAVPVTFTLAGVAGTQTVYISVGN
jgi:uncharacterized protein (TIGR03437 family)